MGFISICWVIHANSWFLLILKPALIFLLPGLVFQPARPIAQDSADLLLTRLQPAGVEHVLQPGLHAGQRGVAGGAEPGVLPALQLGHAGALQLCQQHHGTHHESVRCSILPPIFPGRLIFDN